MTEPARPPKGLGPAGSKLWRSVVRAYDLEAHDEVTLGLACRSLDRIAAAQAVIEAEGFTVPGRQGQRPHPALQVEAGARGQYLRALAALKLDAEPVDKHAQAARARSKRWP